MDGSPVRYCDCILLHVNGNCAEMGIVPSCTLEVADALEDCGLWYGDGGANESTERHVDGDISGLRISKLQETALESVVKIPA